MIDDIVIVIKVNSIKVSFGDDGSKLTDIDASLEVSY